MKFVKDILFFDLETTSQDVERDVVLQVGAVLLDRDNLLEKGFFNAYIRNSLLEGTLKEHAKLLGVHVEELKQAPKPLEVAKGFAGQFGADVTLAVQTPLRLFQLRQLFKKQAVYFPYDLSAIDQWTLQYIYAARMGLKKIPSLHTLGEQFNLHIQHPHDAYERAKLEAGIFRKICQEL
ncbi:MAG: hypothetical protein JNK33_03455 [Candidatus Doudnabacteria bacterium]|nr:hypothetical protein [Candidatus Doudnabacteria bacterium]